MKITKLRIINYKSFRDTGWISLAPNFTVVVGQNNAGKTAFLEAAGFTFVGQPDRARPHRNALLPKAHPLPPHSAVEVTFGVRGIDLKHRALTAGGFDLPWRLQQGITLQKDFERLDALWRSDWIYFDREIGSHSTGVMHFPDIDPFARNERELEWRTFRTRPDYTNFDAQGGKARAILLIWR